MATTGMLSISRLARELKLTAPKLKAVLIEARVLDAATNLPFPEVLTDGRAELVTSEDNKYGKGTVTFAVYRKDIVDHLVQKPSEVEQLAFCASKHYAADRLNTLIVDIGNSFGIFSPYGSCNDAVVQRKLEKHGFTDADWGVFEQCYHSDPHFCGGPAWASEAKTKKELQDAVTKYLTATARIRAQASTTKAASKYAEAISVVCDWLTKPRKK